MPKSDVQSSLRLPEELRDRLAQAAADNGHGIGEEMRRRLEASFGSAPLSDDQKTAKLLQVIARAAAILTSEWAAWHEDARACAVFKAAVADLIGRRQVVDILSDRPKKSDRAERMFGGPLDKDADMLAFLAEIAEGQA